MPDRPEAVGAHGDPVSARRRAIVCFFDPPGCRWQWLLKPGFRHVICALDDGRYWVMVDARDGRPVFQCMQANTYDLAAFWRGHGMTVVETHQRDKPPRSPLAVANCVGVVKWALCIRSFSLTPHQLFKHLRRR